MNKEIVKFLKQKLLTLASYYSDIREYSDELGELENKYHETFECYNLEEYMHGGGEKRTQIAARMLRKTANMFWDIYEESKAELYDVYEKICSLNEEEQVAIWGKKRELMFLLLKLKRNQIGS